jgi:hypothetical protein
MSFASRSHPEHDEQEPAAIATAVFSRPLAPAEVRALRAAPNLPPAPLRPAKPILQRMCDEGYWFCARCSCKRLRCIKLQDERPPDAIHDCGHKMKWIERCLPS